LRIELDPLKILCDRETERPFLRRYQGEEAHGGDARKPLEGSRRSLGDEKLESIELEERAME
jgi:hypothetical protein